MQVDASMWKMHGHQAMDRLVWQIFFQLSTTIKQSSSQTRLQLVHCVIHSVYPTESGRNLNRRYRFCLAAFETGTSMFSVAIRTTRRHALALNLSISAPLCTMPQCVARSRRSIRASELVSTYWATKLVWSLQRSSSLLSCTLHWPALAGGSYYQSDNKNAPAELSESTKLVVPTYLYQVNPLYSVALKWRPSTRCTSRSVFQATECQIGWWRRYL